VTRGAAICDTGADRDVRVDIAESVAGPGSLSFEAREPALKQLAAASNYAEWIQSDHVERGIPGSGTALADLTR
jgi:hypothetical protein